MVDQLQAQGSSSPPTVGETVPAEFAARSDAISADATLRPAGGGFWSSLGYFLRRYPLGAVGAAIVLAIVLMAVFATWITVYDPTTTNSRLSLAPRGGAHPVGADVMSRDMWSRIVYGARISLAVGVGATSLGCLIGVSIGLVSGYFGGWLDL